MEVEPGRGGSGPGRPMGGDDARAFRLLLRLYPRRFREAYGEEMTRFFLERRERAEEERGRLAVARLWARTVVDMMRTAAVERGSRLVSTRRKGNRFMSSFLHDFRYAARRLRKSPLFTISAVAILGVGIGIGTAMFTVVRAVMLEELPVTDADRLVILSLQRDPTGSAFLTLDELDRLRLDSQTLQNVAGTMDWSGGSVPVSEGDRSLVLNMTMVTANFFSVVGARPVLGRFLQPEDGDEGAAPAAVISYRTWQGQFGGDPGALGRLLTTTQDQMSYTIVGVAPPGLDYPVGVDYWIPISPTRPVHLIARLAPDATPESARSEALSIAQVLDSERSSPAGVVGATVEPLDEAMLSDSRPMLLALTGAVALLMLIAWVNVGTLLLMRATGQAQDVAVRRTLGASYGRVARLLLVESLLLGAAGGALGLACAVALLRAFLQLAPVEFPRTEMIGLAGAPVAVAIGLTLLAVLLFGILPPLATARGASASALRIGAHSGAQTKGGRRVRRSLVVSQVVIAVILLGGAGLLIRSVQRLQDVELGYDADGLSIVELGIPYVNYRGDDLRLPMFYGIFETVRAVPGVTAVTPTIYRPFMGGASVRLVREGQLSAEEEANPAVPLEVGGPEYFRAFGIPVLRGRGFLERDREDAPGIAVVSQALARRLWPDTNPIGQRLRFEVGSSTGDVWRTVVGVAGDIRFGQLREPTPTIYVPWSQLHPISGVLAVRTEGDFASVLPAIRRAIRDFDPQMHVWKARTMSESLAGGPLARPRMSALLLSSFGLAALLLAATGLYGVLAMEVREQTHDLGVRMALGATPNRLRRHVLRGALTITAAGAVIGLGGALAGSRLLTSLLFEVSPTDPVTLIGVCALFLAVAAITTYLPARRATRIDPVEALRAD